jgi:hypothetical protein
VNLLAHIQVARGRNDDPHVWLGAALPDLQREAGVAVGELSLWSEPVQRGIACHREADAVFHDLRLFRDQSLALSQSLQAAGVSRGPARAVAHAGWELLFDGALLGDDQHVEAYSAAMAVDVAHAGAGLGVGHADRWRAALARRLDRGAPTFYGDPASVAELLWRVLSPRRLLAFDRAQIPTIAGVLREAQPAIAASVDEVFAAVG